MLGFSNPAVLQQREMARQANFASMVTQGSNSRLRQKMINQAKYEQKKAEEKANQGGLVGGLVGGFGGALTGFVTGGPTGALIGAAKGAIGGMQTGRSTGDPAQGALFGAAQGAIGGISESQRLEEQALKQQQLDLLKDEQKMKKDISEIKTSVDNLKEKSKKEVKLRGEFEPYQKDLNALVESKKIIDGAIDQKTGPGDMTAIYNFIKLQDPNAVKEGEIALAKGATGKFPQLANWFNLASSGVVLPESSRDKFKIEANRIYTNKLNTYENAYDKYETIGLNQNLDLVNIFGNVKRKDLKDLKSNISFIPESSTGSTKQPKSLLRKAMDMTFGSNEEKKQRIGVRYNTPVKTQESNEDFLKRMDTPLNNEFNYSGQTFKLPY